MLDNQLEPMDDLPLLWLVIHSPRAGYLVHMFTLRSPKKSSAVAIHSQQDITFAFRRFQLRFL